jgi:hypothetical protein
MSDKELDSQASGLTDEELERETVAELPNREAMTLLTTPEAGMMPPTWTLGPPPGGDTTLPIDPEIA